MEKILSMLRQNDLSTMIDLLKIALNEHTTQSQNKVYNKLKEIQQNPQTYYYLAFIFLNNNYQFGLRQMSGLTLKSFLLKNKTILDKQCISTIKQLIMQDQKQQNAKLTTIKDILISQLVHINNNQIDYQVLAYLIKKGSIKTIKVILQDLRYHSQNYQIWAQQQFINFMEAIIKSLGHLFMTDQKTDAIKCMNLLIYPLPQRLLHYLPVYIDNILYSALKSNNNEMIVLGFQGLTAIAQSKHNLIQKDLIIFLSKMENVNKQILRLEANLWIQIIDGDEDDIFQDMLQVLALKFIKMLQFTQQDYHNLKEDTQVNWYGQSDDLEANQDKNEKIIKRGGNFTIRKASVLCIEKLSLKYSNKLWNQSQKVLGQAILSQNWKFRQSAILYIGIIAPQSLDQIRVVIDNLLKLLFENFKSNSPSMLLATNFWTLQKMAEVLFDHKGFEAILQIAIECCQNQIEDIVVQAAMSFLDEYIVHAKQNIPNKHINYILIVVIPKIQSNNSSGKLLFSSFRVLSQILEECPFSIPDDQCSQIFKILLSKWDSNHNNDNVVCPLIECLVIGCQKKKSVFQLYANSTLLRCVSTFYLENTRRPLVLRAIDLCSSILSLQLPSINNLLQQNQQILNNSMNLLKSQNQETKNFTFGLISDILKNISINFNFQSLLQTVAGSIDKNNLTSVNNGLLCLTDIISFNKSLGQQYIFQIMDIALFHLAKPNLERIFGRNMSKVVGRLCLFSNNENGCYQKVKPVWNNLCMGLRTQEADNHSDCAFQGILKICYGNLQKIGVDMQFLIDSFISYPTQNKILFERFQTVLRSFRHTLKIQQWVQFLNRPIFLPGAVRKIQSIIQNEQR